MTEPPNKQKSIHPKPNQNSPPLLLFLLSALIWTFALIGMGFWHYYSARNAIIENARTAARYSILKDKTYRHWASEHGGVYVPTTEKTPPSPYLSSLPERDLVTPSGRHLTLVNPAYMTRQVHEMANTLFDSKGKITSLDPLRPENAPDLWEEEALLAFSEGVAEWSAFVQINSDRHLRLMQPLVTEAGCLKCHAHQGYTIGDIRGGISVTVPWYPYQQALTTTFSGIVFGYGAIWLTGLVFIGLHRRKFMDFLRLRRESEQKEAEGLRHFQEIFNGVNDAIFLHDLESGKILDVNACAEREFGYNKQEFKQLSVANISADVLHYTGAEAKAWMDKARQGESPTFEWRARHKDGHLIWVEVKMRKSHLLGQPVLLATTRNIDKRKAAEVLLIKQQQELEQRNAELERFNYTISHDLKTPLVTIETFLGFLNEDLVNRDPVAVDKDIDHIRGATRQMSFLLDSLLRLARIRHTEQSMQRCSFLTIVNQALTLVAGPLTERGVQINLINTDTPVYGHPAQLVEIWQNLIENAVKYMGNQSQPHIDIGFDFTDPDVVFFVRDNGIGIEPEFIDKIFGLFNQLDPKAPGNGLGLALVKQIIGQNNGRIWLESAGVNQGCCFYFTLPTASGGDKRT